MEGLYRLARDQLWAKPRPTFEPSGLLDVCSMFARLCNRGIKTPAVSKAASRQTCTLYAGLIVFNPLRCKRHKWNKLLRITVPGAWCLPEEFSYFLTFYPPLFWVKIRRRRTNKSACLKRKSEVKCGWHAAISN